MKKLILTFFLLSSLNFSFAKTTYSIEVDVDIFEYEGENLPKYQLEISRDLRAYYRNLTDFSLDLNQFMQIANFYSRENLDYKNTLKLCSKKIASNDNYVQIFYVSATSCDSSREHFFAKSFNYLIEAGDAKKLTLQDICLSPQAKENLLHRAFLNLKNYENYQEAVSSLDYENFDKYKSFLLTHSSFLLSKDSVILVLPILGNGIFNSVYELSYDEAGEFLNMELIKNLKLSESIDKVDIMKQITPWRFLSNKALAK